MHHTRAALVVLLSVLAVPLAHAQIRNPPKKHTYTKLESALSALLEQMDAGVSEERAVETLQNALTQEQYVPVSIRTTDAVALSGRLTRLGVRTANSNDDVVEAYVTPATLRSLASMPEVTRISQITPPELRSTSQGVVGHNASAWHAAGYTGANIKVGIIDIGFQGISSLVGTEIPNNLVGRCYSSIGVFSGSLSACQSGSPHGTAVTESLVDVAPGVLLYIANPISNLDFRQTVDWMTSQGVRVINYSAANRWDGPGNGTSPFSDSPLKTVDAAVAGGAVFVAAAGNEGTATYLGAFHDVNGNGWAEFHAGIEDNAVQLLAGERISIQLRWQDSWTAAARDLDLFLYTSYYTLVASSVDLQGGWSGDTPFESLTYTAPFTGIYYIGVYHYSGVLPGWIQLQNFTSQDLTYFTSGGSIANPAETANAGALAVGAAPWYNNSAIEPYSSQGPTPDGRVKPDIVGGDKADTATYGANGFSGTSQASPHVAGLAALVLQAFPGYAASQVAYYLKYYAAPRGSGHPNNAWGYGFAWLPNILTPPAAPTGLTATLTAPHVRLTWIPSSGATSYTVKRSTVSGAETVLAAGVTSTTYTDTSVLRGTRYFYVVSAVNGAGESPNSIEVSLVVPAAALGSDFDADGRPDLAIWRPSTGYWYVLTSSSAFASYRVYNWGVAGDKPVPADYDGDGTTDVAVWRPSTGRWYVLTSSTGFLNYWVFNWGVSGDKPVPADYDGDGRVDIAVWRPSNGYWYILTSSSGFANCWVYNWGLPGDLPIVADYDGDRRADIAVWRPSTGQWFILVSTTGYSSYWVATWGVLGDTPVAADFDGDHRAEIGVWRPSAGRWYLLKSSTNWISHVEYVWGAAGDTVIDADFDGDGLADLAAWRPGAGHWFICGSATGYSTYAFYAWGMEGDVALGIVR